MTPQAFIEMPRGFLIGGSASFPSDHRIEVGGLCLATQCRNWLEEHPIELPGGGERNYSHVRVTIEFMEPGR